MKRGNYKQHDYSIEKMPKSTRYDLAKKLKAQESEELKQIYNQNLNSFIQPTKPHTTTATTTTTANYSTNSRFKPNSASESVSKSNAST